MEKSIYNSYENYVGKSLYNINNNTSSSTSSTGTLDNFLNAIINSGVINVSNVSSVSSGSNTTTTTSTTISNTNSITSNTTTTATLDVLQSFYFNQTAMEMQYNEQPSYLTLSSSTSNYVLINTNNTTSLYYNVQYIHLTNNNENYDGTYTPDYPDTIIAGSYVENYFQILDSKVKIEGPWTFINSAKMSVGSNLLTVNYYDRLKVALDSTILSSSYVLDSNYGTDRGINFEYAYLIPNESSYRINMGYFGYSRKINRFVFYNDAVYNTANQTVLYCQEHSELSVAKRYQTDTETGIAQTATNLDIIYTNIINSPDSKCIGNPNNNLYINSTGLITITANSNYILTSVENIIVNAKNKTVNLNQTLTENATSYIGNYTSLYQIGNSSTYTTNYKLYASTVNENGNTYNGYYTQSVNFGNNNSNIGIFNVYSNNLITIQTSKDTSNGILINALNSGIQINSGILGYINQSSGTISIQTSNTSSNILIGTETNVSIKIGKSNSSISLNEYISIGNILNTTNYNITTLISRNFTGTNSTDILTNLEISGTISGSNNNIYGAFINQKIISSGNANLYTSLKINTPYVTTNSNIIDNISALYIDGITNLQTDIIKYGIYTKTANIFFGGSNSEQLKWTYNTNVLSLSENSKVGIGTEIPKAQLNLVQNNTSIVPNIRIENNIQSTETYFFQGVGTNLIECFINGTTSRYQLQNNNSYNISGIIYVYQIDGSVGNFQLNSSIIYTNNTVTLKNVNINICTNDYNYFWCDLNIFNDNSGNYYLQINGTTNNNNIAKWNCTFIITTIIIG
jgi:hypothetical protein